MSVTILPTKLSIPPPRTSRVVRTRLTEALSAGIYRKLTLVSAPAGFGKTTLVADWLTGWIGRAAWVTLDEGDGDISSFLTYLAAALQPATGRGNELLEMARSPQSSPESIVTTLIGDLSRVGENVIIVLDDYHVVESRAVDSALQFLLDNLPQSTRLVITTREDPQIGLSRLRARDELSEIRVADLRFDMDESQAFLNRVMGLGLPVDAVETLERRTEGWVAGLQLAALSMRDSDDRERFVEAFSGSHRYVLDYLAEDVLDRLPLHIREFLNQTSILDRFCADLCDAVTGRSDSAAVIDYLDRANLFVLPLDAERRWYRYHRLFLDLLRVRSGDVDRTSAELHVRASDWFRRNDLPIEGFAHAVAAGDTDRAAQILEGDGMPIHYQGTFAPVERWLVSLTPQVLDERPALRIACAWVLTTRGTPPGEVDALLEPAENAALAMPSDRRRDDLRGQIAAIRALLAIPRGELEPIITNAHSALELLDPENRPVRTSVAWSLGYAHQLLGELGAARAAFEQSIREGRASGNLVITIGATISLGQVCEREYRLREAAQSYHEVLRLAGDPPLPYACEAYLGLARVHFARNELEPARTNAALAREIGLQLLNVDTPGMAALLEARIELAQGEREAATAALNTAGDIFRDRGIEHHGADLGDVKVGVLIEGGHLTAALATAREHSLTDRIAQLFLLDNDPTAALQTLGAYVQTEGDPKLRNNLTSHILAAAALSAAGEHARARKQLEAILPFVEPEGIIRPFVDMGPLVRPVLADPGVREHFPIYAETLIDAFGEPPECDTLSEPLSRRELEVLRLIADGLSNREIGDRLFIALDTVKGHTRKIYEKLDVNRRTEALARATKIGLLQ